MMLPLLGCLGAEAAVLFVTGLSPQHSCIPFAMMRHVHLE